MVRACDMFLGLSGCGWRGECQLILSIDGLRGSLSLGNQFKE
jgi:hypothetical protein